MAISLALICLISYLICSIFDCALCFFVSAFGLVVLNIEILSLFKGISPIGIFTVNILSLIVVLYFWVKRGRPLLKPDFTGFKRVLNSFKLDKGLLILGLGFLFLVAVNFILSAFMPVNDPDALSYRGYRALVWAQNGYIHHFDAMDVRNLIMPINSEIVYCWIYALTGKDIGFGFLNFFSFLFCTGGIWELLKRLKFSFRKRFWAIFVFSSFAGIISQISSTQGDLLTGTLILYSMIFFYDAVNDKGKGRLYFSSLCAALALGTKSTAFMVYLPLFVMFLIYAVKKEKGGKFLKFTGLLALNFIIFSSYNYILNLIDYSNPLGSEISMNNHGFFGGFKAFLANFITYNIQLIDSTGFRWGEYLNERILNFKDIIFAFLKIPKDFGAIMPLTYVNSTASEFYMGFGITSLLAFFPCAVFCIFKLFKKCGEKRKILYSLGLLFYLCLIVLSFGIGYMVYSIRFITAFITVASPIIVLCYFKKNNFYKTLVILFCLFYMLLLSTHLGMRPFFKAYESLKAEKSYEDFAYNTRCLNYDYYRSNKKSCAIENNMLANIKPYSTVGIFADSNLLLLSLKINFAKRHVITEELLLTRFEKYNLKKYDYIITPHPVQILDNVGISDDTKDCKPAKSDFNGKTFCIGCKVPYDKLKAEGFNPVYHIKADWINEEGVDTHAYYIIWTK